ncbi:MAG: hypothetical protein ACKO91_04325 [Acidimicrobiales bacterium]
MLLPRPVPLESDALAALAELLGIMTDQLVFSAEQQRWSIAAIADLSERIAYAQMLDESTMVLGLDDVALLIDGMAFTEHASAELPWIELVRWASDFIVGELRPFWSEQEWHEYMAGPR